MEFDVAVRYLLHNMGMFELFFRLLGLQCFQSCVIESLLQQALLMHHSTDEMSV